eukprot:CAMPEP_0184707932 /NCGR_PEP_ID=MMETSP0313-20130426/37519_1 /TAXON_ID=2792 /ORGANISM="Porphyridium aerugineum, Strain SAG 1380-2" /LENGTH=259 /DNA_ID=CAMNT_0027169513 /DNA_START=116 /DNA_END=895 /DNA_ORIENTATION=-
MASISRASRLLRASARTYTTLSRSSTSPALRVSSFGLRVSGTGGCGDCDGSGSGCGGNKRYFHALISGGSGGCGDCDGSGSGCGNKRHMHALASGGSGGCGDCDGSGSGCGNKRHIYALASGGSGGCGDCDGSGSGCGGGNKMSVGLRSISTTGIRMKVELPGEGAMKPADEMASMLSSDEIKERVLKVVKSFDKVGEKAVSPTSKFHDDLALDSLDTVELVMNFEDEFKIEIPDTDADKIQSVQDALLYLETRKPELV